MSWDRNLAEARLTLGLVHPEDMPALAIQALEAGLDGPRIRYLAGLNRPSGWESDQLLPAFMEEAGLFQIPSDRAWTLVAADLARKILNENLDPLKYSRTLERMWIQSRYVEALGDLGQLDDGVRGHWGRSHEELTRVALEDLRKLVALADEMTPIKAPKST